MRLPDLLAPATVAHLDDRSRALLEPPWPRVAIAAGRRTAAVLRWVKRQAGDAVLTVYLMRPARLRGIDLAVVPAHDRPRAHPKVVTTLGALHPLDRSALDAADDTLPEDCRALPRPFVTVLVGGPSRRVRFGAADLDALARAVNGLAAGLGGSVLATTSRRTPAGFAARLDAALTVPHRVHDAAGNAPNPLRAFLAAADRLVVTDDSASMLSEACATGRPVHLWRLRGTSAKLGALAEALAAQGCLRPWTDVATTAVAPLDEAGRAARLVRRRLST